MLEMHPTKMISADMYIQAMRRDERDAKEPQSLLKHLSYLELKRCCGRKTPDGEAISILIGQFGSLNEL